MAEVTRTYAYADQTDFKSGAISLALTKFTASGSTLPIGKITSISARWHVFYGTSSQVTNTAYLTISGTSYESSGYTYRGENDDVVANVTFSSLPSAKDWVESNITFSTKYSTKMSEMMWRSRIVITLTYEPVSFAPVIDADSLKIYRANSSGKENLNDLYLSFTCKVKVGSTGSDSTGVLTVDRVGTDGTLTQYYQNKSVNGSTSWTTVSAAPISTDEAKTLATGVSAYFRFTYAYTATSTTGVTSTDTVSTDMYVPEAFTNLHLSGYSTGGVAVGKYSASTLNNPMFESNYPAYFYKGVLEFPNIQTGTTTAASHANGTNENILFTTAFAAAPQVFCTMDASDSGAAFGGCFVAVKNVTASGFTIRYANTSGATRKFAVRWLAYGKPKTT